MENTIEKARSFIGKFVVLNAVGLRNREPKMRRKEGIVVGTNSYPEKIEGSERKLIHYRCMVEWELGGPLWSENPDNLKIIVKESANRSFAARRPASDCS